MSLGLCALFKVKMSYIDIVKFAIVAILQLQNKKKYTKSRNILLVTIL